MKSRETIKLSELLSQHNLFQYASIFEEQQVDIDSFYLLEESDLVQLGVPLGPRKILLKLIADKYDKDLNSLNTGAERRYITVLFCDLVGSTKLAEEMDPEDFRVLIQDYLRKSTNIIQRFGGVIASYAGDAVKGLFGYPIAQEDDAVNAIYAGLAIVHSIEELSAPLNKNLSVRIGVSSGLAVLANYEGGMGKNYPVAFGEVAHLAARLQGVALPNNIVTDVATQESTSSKFAYEDHGEHSLKGFSESIKTHRVIGEARNQTNLGTRKEHGKLIGREFELEILTESVEVVRKTKRSAKWLVHGEAGIGKSRLAHEFGESMCEQGIEKVGLTCSSRYSSTAFYPWIKWLDDYCHSHISTDAMEPWHVLERLISQSSVPLKESLSAVFSLLEFKNAPDLLAVANPDPQTQRRIVKDVLVDIISNFSSGEPLLLIIDDIHWMDPSSKELLTKLEHAAENHQILILLTVRDSYLDSLRQIESYQRLKVERLTEEECHQMLLQFDSSFDANEQLDALVIKRSDGVPLFLEELYKTYKKVTTSDNYSGNDAVDDNQFNANALQSALLARLDKLGDGKRVAQISAVIGRSFTKDLLLMVSELPDKEIDQALAELVADSLIVQEEGAKTYVFKHMLLQEAAESLLLREDRKGLHRKVANQLIASGSSSIAPEQIAYHFSEARDHLQAATYWFNAADNAAKTWAKIEASQIYSKGLQQLRELPVDETIQKLLLEYEIKKGNALYEAYGFITSEGTAAYRNAIKISRRMGNSIAPIDALDGLFGTYFNSARWSEAIEISDQLIEIGERNDLIKAKAIGLQFKGMALFCVGDFDDSRYYLRESLRYTTRASEIGSDYPSMALIYLSWVYQFRGEEDKALQSNKTAEQDVAGKGAYRKAAYYGNSCVLFSIRDDVGKVEELTEALIPISKANGFNIWLNMGKFFQGWVASRKGDAAYGVSMMRNIVENLGELEIEKTCYLGLLAQILLDEGEDKEAKITIDQAIEQATRTEEAYFLSELYGIRGDVLFEGSRDFEQAAMNYANSERIAIEQGANYWLHKTKRRKAKLEEISGVKCA